MSIENPKTIAEAYKGLEAEQPNGSKGNSNSKWIIGGVSVGAVAVTAALALIILTAPISVPVITAGVFAGAAFLAAAHVLPLIGVVSISLLASKIILGAIAAAAALTALICFLNIKGSTPQPQPFIDTRHEITTKMSVVN